MKVEGTSGIRGRVRPAFLLVHGMACVTLEEVLALSSILDIVDLMSETSSSRLAKLVTFGSVKLVVDMAMRGAKY